MFQDRLAIHEGVKGEMVRGRGFVDNLHLRGRHHVQLIRSGEVIADFYVDNGVTNAGKNLLWNVMFNGATASTTWYVALVNGSTFTAFAASDTPSSHAGWTEFTNYDFPGESGSTVRPPWGQGTATGQAITNASAVEFDFSATGVVHGIVIWNTSAKSATTGVIWSAAAFNADLNVTSGDILKVTYTAAL